MTTIDINAEVFAAKAYGQVVPQLERWLEMGKQITREDIEKEVRGQVFRTEYALDERMVEYLTDSLSGSYIG